MQGRKKCCVLLLPWFMVKLNCTTCCESNCSQIPSLNGSNCAVIVKLWYLTHLISFRDPQSEKKLTGGANWMPQVAPTSWGTPGAPIVRTTCKQPTLTDETKQGYFIIIINTYYVCASCDFGSEFWRFCCLSRPVPPLELQEHQALAWWVLFHSFCFSLLIKSNITSSLIWFVHIVSPACCRRAWSSHNATHDGPANNGAAYDETSLHWSRWSCCPRSTSNKSHT